MQIFRIIRRIYVIVFKNYVYEKVDGLVYVNWTSTQRHKQPKDIQRSTNSLYNREVLMCQARNRNTSKYIHVNMRLMRNDGNWKREKGGNIRLYMRKPQI